MNKEKIIERIKLFLFALVIVFTLLTIAFFTWLSFSVADSSPGFFGGSCEYVGKERALCGYPIKSSLYAQSGYGKFPSYELLERNYFYRSINLAYWLLLYSAIASFGWFVITKIYQFIVRKWVKKGGNE